MKLPTNIKLADVLLIEDSLGDIVLTKATLKMSNIRLNLHVVRDGEEALMFLNKCLVENSLPSLILVDFNLPKKNGLEILAWIKGDQRISDVPVMMLSGSTAPNEIDIAIEIGAQGHLVKPLSDANLTDIVDTTSSLYFKRQDDVRFMCTA